MTFLCEQVKRTSVQKTLGKKKTVSAVVVTGNGNGAIGMLSNFCYFPFYLFASQPDGL